MPTLPLTDTAEFSARNVPWTRKLPFTVSAQLFAAVVSSAPVNPVMSMPPIVVAAASVTVPVGFALKTATSVAAGVQPHGAPPEEFDQLEALFQAPPFPIRWHNPLPFPHAGAAPTSTAGTTHCVAA